MTDLLSIPTPRPQAIVDELTAAHGQRGRRIVWRLLVLLGSVTGIVLGVTECFQTTFQLGDDNVRTAALIVNMALLAFVLTRKRVAPVLVRDGVAHRVTKVREDARGKPYVEVWWDDDRRSALVHLQPPLRALRADAAVVLTLPRKKLVGVMLGDQRLRFGAER